MNVAIYKTGKQALPGQLDYPLVAFETAFKASANPDDGLVFDGHIPSFQHFPAAVDDGAIDKKHVHGFIRAATAGLAGSLALYMGARISAHPRR